MTVYDGSQQHTENAEEGIWACTQDLCGKLPLVPNRRAEVEGMGINLRAAIQKVDRMPVIHSATWKFADTIAELLSLLSHSR